MNTLLVNPMGDTLDRQLDGLGQLLELVDAVNTEAVDIEAEDVGTLPADRPSEDGQPPEEAER